MEIEFEVEEWEGRGWMLHAGDVFLGFYETKEIAQQAADWLAANILARVVVELKRSLPN